MAEPNEAVLEMGGATVWCRRRALARNSFSRVRYANRSLAANVLDAENAGVDRSSCGSAAPRRSSRRTRPLREDFLGRVVRLHAAYASARFRSNEYGSFS